MSVCLILMNFFPLKDSLKCLFGITFGYDSPIKSFQCPDWLIILFLIMSAQFLGSHSRLFQEEDTQQRLTTL